MLCSPQEFDARLAENHLIITLIGMSGIGKSYRASQLSLLGFKHQCCDNFIASQLSELIVSSGETGLAKWMGQPFTAGYQDREKEYLALEERGVNRALVSLDGNTTIDTTGSVIHISSQVQGQLKRRSLIVYLEADTVALGDLFERYRTDPKPVVWGKSLERAKGESDQETLKRYFPALIRSRSQRYSELADITMPYNIAKDEAIDGREFLRVIRKCLEH